MKVSESWPWLSHTTLKVRESAGLPAREVKNLIITGEYKVILKNDLLV